jgi:hypothetical protein
MYPHVLHQTLLADGGCILGATMPHVVVDGESMHSVLEALAAAYCKLAGGTPACGMHSNGPWSMREHGLWWKHQR